MTGEGVNKGIIVLKEKRFKLSKKKKKTPPNEEDMQLIKANEEELDEILRLEEIRWSQRAKVKWIQASMMMKAICLKQIGEFKREFCSLPKPFRSFPK